MPLTFPSSGADRRVLTVAVGCLVLALVLVFTGGDILPDEGAGPLSGHDGQNAPLTGDEPIDEGAAVTAAHSPVLGAPAQGADAVSELREGIPLPVIERDGEFYRVLTPCEIDGWLPVESVRAYPRTPDGMPEGLGEATILIDPGHGGRDVGAVGPGGFTEEEANRAITARLVSLLTEPEGLRSVGTGIVPEDELRAPRVLLTRNGDYYAGLRFRAELANRLNAHAFVSIHNNASPDLGLSDRPGTEMYYQHRSPESRRLAGLLYEEVYRAVEPHDVQWVTNRDAGVKYRLGREGDDYYAVLRRPEVPSVLVEALFISNPPEEELLRRETVQQSIAEAHASAFIRYFGTDDPGSGFVDPIDRPPVPGGGMISDCVDPA